MRIKRFTFDKSNKWVLEKHKPIIPTVIYYNETLGSNGLITFKFMFWRWWVKIGIRF